MSRARRSVALAALGGLVVLWVTWPGAGIAAPLGAVGFLACGGLLIAGRDRLALAALAAALATLLAVEAGPTAWRPWAAAGLAVTVLEDLLVPGGERAPTEGWPQALILVATLLGTAGLLAAWRPMRSSLQGPEGALLATLLLAAVGTGLAIWLTAPTGDEAQDPEA